MINNFDKDFFNKNTRIKLCSLGLTALMIASPFIVKGMVDKAIDDLEHHNEVSVTEDQETEEKSKISINYEGEFNYENGVIIIYKNEERMPNEDVELLGIITPNADEPSCELTAGDYIIANDSGSYEIELDGLSDYNYTVNYQDGTITNTNEQTQKPKHIK